MFIVLNLPCLYINLINLTLNRMVNQGPQRQYAIRIYLYCGVVKVAIIYLQYNSLFMPYLRKYRIFLDVRLEHLQVKLSSPQYVLKCCHPLRLI